MEGGRYSASFNGSKQTLSSSSPSSPSSPVSSHEILERAALFLDWYHGQQQKLQQQKLMMQQQQQQQYQQQQQQQETLNSFLVSETAAVPEQQQLGVANSDLSLTEAVVPISASLPPTSPTSSLEQQHQEKLPSFATLTSAIKNNSCNNNGENAGFYFQPADQVISSTELLLSDCSPLPPPLSSSSSSSTTEQAATASAYEANDFIMYDYYEHFQSQAQQQQQQFPDPLPPAQSCNQSSFY